MIEQIFNHLGNNFNPASIRQPTSIYFSIGETKKTVIMTPDGCQVADGRILDNADCICKTSGEFFLNVWNNGYKPGIKDFLSGKIKSNDPRILESFLRACGKP